MVLHSLEPFMAACQYPSAAYPFADNPAMTIIQTIAANLTAWMRDTPGLDTIDKVAEASGVGFGTVRRTKNGEGNPTAQNLHEIASVFGRRAADLMIEDAPYPSAEIRAFTVRDMDKLEPPIDQIVAQAREMTREGQFVLLGQAQVLKRDYAKAKANPAS
jgi:transcriptional regulator with XRE-family HTH domain